MCYVGLCVIVVDATIGGGTGGARGAVAPPFFNMGRQPI